MCSHLQAPQLKGRLLGLRPCLRLSWSHREILSSNHKPKDSVPFTSTLKLTMLLSNQPNNFNPQENSEVFISRLLTPVQLWGCCEQCTFLYRQYLPGGLRLLQGLLPISSTSCCCCLNNSTLRLFSMLTVCKQIYNHICRRHLHSMNT